MTAVSVYPYRFLPVYKEKIWGSRGLERLFGRELPARALIGESWELADLPEGESLVAEGPDAGRPLNALLAEKGRDILGDTPPPADGRFPLLLKLLSADDILSLQVHPDEQAAKALGPPAAPKTECWYVLESRGGYILKGVRPGVTEQAFRRALSGGDEAEALTGLVQRFEVKEGDFHYLPAGTLHALGPGVVVAEVQTPSDTTYRVSDWGRGRETHVAQALRCIHFAPAPEPPGAAGEVLVRTPYFAVRRVVQKPGEQPLRGGGCVAWMVLAGRGSLSGDDGPAARLGPGETVLIPAGVRNPTWTVEAGMTILEVLLPA
jgi:mannose-6-phosphate isomerase